MDRRVIVSQWMWWATFHAGIARNLGIHGAGLAAAAAQAEVWKGRA